MADVYIKIVPDSSINGGANIDTANEGMSITFTHRESELLAFADGYAKSACPIRKHRATDYYHWSQRKIGK